MVVSVWFLELVSEGAGSRLPDILASLGEAADSLAILLPVREPGHGMDALNIPAIACLSGLHV